jgi:hypothetical protein
LASGARFCADCGTPVADERQPVRTEAVGTENIRGHSLGITALVLGIVSILVVWMPCIGMYLAPVALVAVILAILGLVYDGQKGFAIGGMVTGVLACGIAVLQWALVAGMVGAFNEAATRSQMPKTPTAPTTLEGK